MCCGVEKSAGDPVFWLADASARTVGAGRRFGLQASEPVPPTPRLALMLLVQQTHLAPEAGEGRGPVAFVCDVGGADSRSLDGCSRAVSIVRQMIGTKQSQVKKRLRQVANAIVLLKTILRGWHGSWSSNVLEAPLGSSRSLE